MCHMTLWKKFMVWSHPQRRTSWSTLSHVLLIKILIFPFCVTVCLSVCVPVGCVIKPIYTQSLYSHNYLLHGKVFKRKKQDACTVDDKDHNG